MSHKSHLLTGAFTIAALAWISQSTAQPFPAGGVLENPGKAVARAALGRHQVNGFVPDRGLFRFPAPYNTQGVRITNASDCAGGDCVNYAGYSYWRNMNNHVGKASMLIFLGLDRQRGGRGPSLYELHKDTGNLVDLGALFPESHRLSWASGEGWYFSATRPTSLYLNDGPRLARYDVITEQMETVFDITEQMGDGFTITQMHSSDNDRVHSATVRDDQNFQVKGCVAYDENSAGFHFYPITQAFDECQVDRSGEYLIIKANIDGKDGEDNLIVTLRTGEERLLRDKDGAGGHSDVGHGYMIAADNWAKDANAWKLWDLTTDKLKGEPVYHNNDWDNFSPAHLSHTNARAGVDARQQYACGSSVNRGNGVHANEVVCFTLDGSGATVAVAPTMTSLDAQGGGNEYARFAKGNLDVSGQYFLWSSNMGGDRLDMFVVRVPDHLLTDIIDQGVGNGGYGPRPPAKPAAPVPDTGPKPVGGAIAWQDTRNIEIANGRLVKTAGCEGCPDSGAISAQVAAGTRARLDFTAETSGQVMFAGFSRWQRIPDSHSLEFGIRLQDGVAEVREHGGYRADIAFQPGDRFSINISNGKVEYLRNQAVFYTSWESPTHPLYSGVGLFGLGASISDMALAAD